MLVDGVLLYNTPLLLVQGEYNSVRSIIINCLLSSQGMPRGLKQSSSVVAIGFSADEQAANTFTESAVDLNLSPLDREVFVVLAINMDPFYPEAIAATDTRVSTSLTSTSQATAGRPTNLSNPNCLAAATNAIQQGTVPFQTTLETPPANLDYIGIIATNDFFVQVQGANNANPTGVDGKLYGYRAVADADIYAALVQSEALSA